MIINDRVWGEIPITYEENKIINSSLFQRLKGIKQLGMSFTIFPNLIHTRFEHSIGVMHVASMMFDKIFPLNKKFPSDFTRESCRQVLRTAALLHDIGHLPFSHTAEKEILGTDGGHEKLGDKLLVEYMSVERWAILIYRAWILLHHLSEGDLVTNISRQILSSKSFGADRIDYVMRDRVYYGNGYGPRIKEQFNEDNLNHLISGMKIKDGGIEFSLKAQKIIRHLYFCRLDLSIRIYDNWSFQETNKRMSSFMKSILTKDQLKYDNFLSYDDRWVVDRIKPECKRGNTHALLLKDLYRKKLGVV